MKESIRRTVCRLIAGIVVVDDDLDPAEDVFVERMLSRFGLTSEDREALFPIMDAAEAAREFGSLPDDVRRNALELLVEAVAIDKRYTDEERGYLHAVAQVAGVSAEEVDRLVEERIGTK